MNYYNEFDRSAAAWLRELIAAGEIPPGHVDERSICDVEGKDLHGYTQCHFFAGIGGWSYALRLAGWPDDRPVWTGSCPCQPFSLSGKRLGIADERHLWPEFFRLIGQRKPGTIFGEQVASNAGRAWLAGVRTGLETMGFAVGAADLCAASVGAPHRRQRLYWVANAARDPSWGGIEGGEDRERAELQYKSSVDGNSGCLANMPRPGLEGHAGNVENGHQSEWLCPSPAGHAAQGGWHDFEIVGGLDGKSRRIESGVPPVVDGLPRGVVCCGDPCTPGYAEATAEARVMRLRGYGNAIVPQLAAVFIQAATEQFSARRARRLPPYQR